MRRPRAARPTVQRSAFGGLRFPPDVITVAVRWYLRYSLSYRDAVDQYGQVIDGLLSEQRDTAAE